MKYYYIACIEQVDGTRRAVLKTVANGENLMCALADCTVALIMPTRAAAEATVADWRKTIREQDAAEF